jgi:hypothetical protein
VRPARTLARSPLPRAVRRARPRHGVSSVGAAPLVFIGPAFLVPAIDRAPPGRRLLTGFLFGAGFFAPVLWWGGAGRRGRVGAARRGGVRVRRVVRSGCGPPARASATDRRSPGMVRSGPGQRASSPGARLAGSIGSCSRQPRRAHPDHPPAPLRSGGLAGGGSRPRRRPPGRWRTCARTGPGPGPESPKRAHRGRRDGGRPRALPKLRIGGGGLLRAGDWGLRQDASCPVRGVRPLPEVPGLR